MWACLVACPVGEITSFVVDSSPSRKSIFVLLYIIIFPNIRNSTINREFPQELFWMTLRHRGKQSNLWRQTGQPEMTPSVAFRVKSQKSQSRNSEFPHASASPLLFFQAHTFANFEPKGPNRTSPALLPPARFFWSTVLLPRALALASARVHQLGAHPATGGTRKLSAAGVQLYAIPNLQSAEMSPCASARSRATIASRSLISWALVRRVRSHPLFAQLCKLIFRPFDEPQKGANFASECGFLRKCGHFSAGDRAQLVSKWPRRT